VRRALSWLALKAFTFFGDHLFLVESSFFVVLASGSVTPAALRCHGQTPASTTY